MISKKIVCLLSLVVVASIPPTYVDGRSWWTLLPTPYIIDKTIEGPHPKATALKKVASMRVMQDYIATGAGQYSTNLNIAPEYPRRRFEVYEETIQSLISSYELLPKDVEELSSDPEFQIWILKQFPPSRPINIYRYLLFKRNTTAARMISQIGKPIYIDIMFYWLNSLHDLWSIQPPWYQFIGLGLLQTDVITRILLAILLLLIPKIPIWRNQINSSTNHPRESVIGAVAAEASSNRSLDLRIRNILHIAVRQQPTLSRIESGKVNISVQDRCHYSVRRNKRNGLGPLPSSITNVGTAHDVRRIEQTIADQMKQEISSYIELSSKNSTNSSGKSSVPRLDFGVREIGSVVNCSVCDGTGKKICKKCAGQGKKLCGRCSGKGAHTCETCGGRQAITCYVCNGKGTRYMPISGKLTDCFECRGTGSRLCKGCYFTSGKVTCGQCNGRGTKHCYSCSGKGSVGCDSCNSYGKKHQISSIEIVSTRTQQMSVQEGDKYDRNNLYKMEPGVLRTLGQFSQTSLFYEDSSFYSVSHCHIDWVQFRITKPENILIRAYGDQERVFHWNHLLDPFLKKNINKLVASTEKKTPESVLIRRTQEILQYPLCAELQLKTSSNILVRSELISLALVSRMQQALKISTERLYVSQAKPIFRRMMLFIVSFFIFIKIFGPLIFPGILLPELGLWFGGLCFVFLLILQEKICENIYSNIGITQNTKVVTKCNHAFNLKILLVVCWICLVVAPDPYLGYKGKSFWLQSMIVEYSHNSTIAKLNPFRRKKTEQSQIVESISILRPSFDCSNKKLNFVENMICKTPALAQLDLQMHQTYRNLIRNSNNPRNIRLSQRAFLKKRNRCRSSHCVARIYQRRLRKLAK